MLHGTLAELRSAEGEQRDQLNQTIARLFLRHSARPPTDDGR
jgi:glutamyl-tRNA reductase